MEDSEIKALLENALKITEEILKGITEIFTKENFPIPKGFGEKDVNLQAPRLFQDEYYPHYLKYAAKAGLSIYSVGIPLIYRTDVKEFFMYCMNSTLELMDQIKELLMDKGLTINKILI